MASPGLAKAPFFLRTPGFFDHDPFTSPTVRFEDVPGSLEILNLGLLLENPDGIPYLRSMRPFQCYSSFAHGDANLQNFLVDHHSNVWVIDFLYTRPRQHILRDISKTMACIMFMATRIESDKQLGEAAAVSLAIASARDMNSPINVECISDLHVLNMYKMLLRLWTHAGRILREQRDTLQLHIALFSDCMRFLFYETRNMYSRKWALITATLLAQSAVRFARSMHSIIPTVVHVAPAPHTLCQGKLAITRCPGNRNLYRPEPKFTLPALRSTPSRRKP